MAEHKIRVIAGADSFGESLKDTLVAHLRALNIDVEDLGTDKYYSVGAEVGRRVSQASTNPHPSLETRGLVACGTGVGVAIFANKFPAVYAASCLTPEEALNARSINSCNVLAVSGMSTDPETAKKILQTFIDTPFKSRCPASGSTPWPAEIESFLDASVSEMSGIGESEKNGDSEPPCLLCSLAKERKEGDFTAVDIMPGASMKIIRGNPTSAVVRFTAGAMEPAHHHTYGHDLVVIKGKKTVWNVSKGARYDLEAGDYLYTPAGDVHRVKYYEDTEFFIKWDGHWDIFLDEDLAAAHAAAAAAPEQS